MLQNKSAQEIAELDIGRATFDLDKWLAGAAGYSFDDWKKHNATANSRPAAETTAIERKYWNRWRTNIQNR